MPRGLQLLLAVLTLRATPLLDPTEVVAAATEVAALGASEFCLVLAVRGPDKRIMERLASSFLLHVNAPGSTWL